ncbi:3-oxoacyl-ACP synthase III family protein [Pedobacter changchengzhani]|nr:ketoacyl-ACP synthase III [Pedobacter changchengzhani]
MAVLKLQGIEVKGISCCVPPKIEYNRDITYLTAEEKEKFITVTGIEERRIAEDDVCASDLSLQASELLFEKLNWDKDSVELLVFVSQSADYTLPVTAAILQDRMGLSKKCLAFDVPLGCSGYVYGISIITGMMKSFNIKRGILIAGDTGNKLISKTDKSTHPLFGDAASATAFENTDSNETILFDLGTDGSGFESIIIRDGGSRNKATEASLQYNEYKPGVLRNNCQLSLNGMDVFSFGISQAPKTVNNLIDSFQINKDEIDYFVFHQANMMINKKITKKLKIPIEKVPYSLKEFGNTSSATIPLTIVKELKHQIEVENKKLLLCGFGVGLSWGTVILTLQKDIQLIYSEYV